MGTARILGVKTPLVSDMMGSGQFQSNVKNGRNQCVRVCKQCRSGQAARRIGQWAKKIPENGRGGDGVGGGEVGGP